MKDKKIILNVVYGLALLFLAIGLGVVVMQLIAIPSLSYVVNVNPSGKLKTFIAISYFIIAILGIPLIAFIISNLFVSKKRTRLVLKYLIIVFGILLSIACIIFACTMQPAIAQNGNNYNKDSIMSSGDFSFYLSSLQTFIELAIISAIFVPFSIYELKSLKKQEAVEVKEIENK